LANFKGLACTLWVLQLSISVCYFSLRYHHFLTPPLGLQSSLLKTLLTVVKLDLVFRNCGGRGTLLFVHYWVIQIRRWITHNTTREGPDASLFAMWRRLATRDGLSTQNYLYIMLPVKDNVSVHGIGIDDGESDGPERYPEDSKHRPWTRQRSESHIG